MDLTKKYNSKGILSNAVNTALLIIDQQTIFCSPEPMMWGNKYTDRAARKISALLPRFRDLNIPVYIAQFRPTESEIPQYYGLYRLTPAAEDVLIDKKGKSAFRCPSLKALLERNPKQSLILCGFDLSVCVYETALDARKEERHVMLLRDLTADGKAPTLECRRDCLRHMEDLGVVFSTSDALLSTASHDVSSPTMFRAAPNLTAMK